jgi:hypothetical protein
VPVSHTISATLPEALRAALLDLAAEESRSISLTAAILIEEGLKARARPTKDGVVLRPPPRAIPVRGVRRPRTNIVMPTPIFELLSDFAWTQRRSISDAIVMLIHDRLEARAARKSA